MSNTLEQRKISHELVEAWDEVRRLNQWGGSLVGSDRMFEAMDAIIAAYTPGYNAESEPDLPEEYDESNKPTEDSREAWDLWARS